MLLQHYDYVFEDEEHGERIAEAIEQQQPALDALSAGARELIERMRRGELPRLEERRSDADLVEIVGSAGGPRYAALFEGDEARAVVQRLAEAAARVLDEEMRLDDLYGLAGPLGLVGLLLTIEPWTVDRERIEEWRRVARRSYEAMTEKYEGGDMEFFAEYMQNVEAGFERLLARAQRG